MPIDQQYISAIPVAFDIIDQILHNSIIVCRDKEINKKLRPFSMSYTMEVLQMTFEQKDMRVDKRIDDSYIRDEDAEDPTPPAKDNICHELGMNKDPNKIAAFRSMNASVLSNKSMHKSSSKKVNGKNSTARI